MVKPERESVLKRTTEIKEKPCLHKRGDIWFHTLVYGDRRIILNKEEKLKVDEKRNT
jgi:hypothetical protein